MRVKGKGEGERGGKRELRVKRKEKLLRGIDSVSWSAPLLLPHTEIRTNSLTEWTDGMGMKNKEFVENMK